MSQLPMKPGAFEIQKSEYGKPVTRGGLALRSIRGIMEIMEREFNSFPEIAETFFYARPVGQGKVATGLSIRAAEFLANYYPNSEYTTAIVGEDEDSITICATFKDEELNTSHSKTVKMSKWFKYKDGRIEKSDPDRLEIRIASFTSKALREVVLRSMPVSLKMHVERRAKEIIGKKMMEPEAVKKLMASFQSFGLEQIHLEKILGKPLGKMDTEDRIFMLSVHNSISDGELNVNQLIEICKDPKVRNIRLAISDLLTGSPLGGGTRVVDLDSMEEQAGATSDASLADGEKKEARPDLYESHRPKRGRPKKESVNSVVDTKTGSVTYTPSESVTLTDPRPVNEDADDPTLTPEYEAGIIQPGQ